MEKQKLKDLDKHSSITTNPHDVTINSRNQLNMTGIIEVISATTSQINAKSECGPISISGRDLRVKLLDIENKLVEIEGEINEVKYTANKRSFFERVFK